MSTYEQKNFKRIVETRLNPSKHLLDIELKEKIEKRKKNGKFVENRNYTKRYWTNNEIVYLEEQWGNMNISTLAKILNRSEGSVREKIYKLKLGDYVGNSKYITVNSIFTNMKNNKGYKYILNKWVNNGFKYKVVKINKRNYKVVTIDYFWKWAEQNKNILNFCFLEKNTFGEEPDWMKNKRLADVQLYKKFYHKKWTPKEDSMLISYYNLKKYNIMDLANLLNRTINSIKNRLKKLNLDIEVINIKPKPKNWTEDEILKLVDLLNKGYCKSLITEMFNNERSTQSIFFKIKHLKEKMTNGISEYDRYLQKLKINNS